MTKIKKNRQTQSFSCHKSYKMLSTKPLFPQSLISLYIQKRYKQALCHFYFSHPRFFQRRISIFLRCFSINILRFSDYVLRFLDYVLSFFDCVLRNFAEVPNNRAVVQATGTVFIDFQREMHVRHIFCLILRKDINIKRYADIKAHQRAQGMGD